MSEPVEVRSWKLTHLGLRVEFYDEVPSTNDLAANASQPGTVIIAREQNSGRGTHGRVWYSPPGSSLLMSINLDPTPELRRPVLLTAWASVAVADAIFQLIGLQARLKWPNDLFLNHKKVCGLLIEQTRWIVLGIGLNLTQTQTDFDQANLPLATSLYVQSGRVLSAATAAEAIVRRLDAEYDELLKGHRLPLETDWHWRVGLMNRPVKLTRLDGQVHTGRLDRLTFDDVELVQADGSRLRLPPEAIRHLDPG